MTDEKDPKPIEAQLAEQIARVLKHFAPGGKMGPIEDLNEYEKLRESLPPLERELNLEVTQFVQLVDYCGRSRIKLGPDVADAMSAAAKLPVEERIGQIREINQGLMKRLNDAGESTPFRM
jgi:hypothetical protein